jgi:hypothetical protein
MRALRYLVVGVGLAVLGLVAAGCQWPWEPKVGPIVGVVRYPSRAPASSTKVWVAGGQGATFSDGLGGFRLSVSGVPGDTVTVVASEGYDGRTHAETKWGAVRVVLHESIIVAPIVLDHTDPI